MAWDSDPEIAALRDYGVKFKRPIVVAFSIHEDGERFQVVTFGKTRELCKLAAAFGDEIAKAVGDGRIAAPQIEPGEQAAIQVWRRDEGVGDAR